MLRIRVGLLLGCLLAVAGVVAAAAGTERADSGPGMIQLLVVALALGGVALLLGRRWRRRARRGRTPPD